MRWKLWLTVAGTAVLPGFLGGVQLAGLLFFLNPGLPFEATSVVRGMLYYGALLGLLSAAVLLPLTWGRPRRARRFLPWSITVVLALAATVHWFHASHFAFFLPPGINERLIKAALWLSLGALIFFYTALLHSLHRRPYGVRSRLGLALLTIATIYVLVERREAFRPRPDPAPLPSAVLAEQPPTLLVVGIERSTLDAVLPLAEQGRLPFFWRLVREGAYGHVSSLDPAGREPAWTTLATGKLPYRHGVVSARVHSADLLATGGSLRLVPSGMGFPAWGLTGERQRRVDATDRRAPAVWDILQRLGVGAGSIGWPVTAPPTPSIELCFSDRFFAGASGTAQALPSKLAERGLLFRVGVDDIDPSLVDRFGAEPPRSLLEELANDLWRQSLTAFILEQRPDLGAVFLMLPGMGPLSERHYGGLVASEFEGAQDPAAERAALLLTSYYQFLDQAIAELWQRLPEPRLLAVVSAYGVEAPGGLRRLWGELVRRPALGGMTGGGPDGVLFLLGRGIRPGTLLARASLVDVMPTLLYGLGFPVARDLDGQVLTTAFESSYLARHPLIFVPSYETLVSPEGAGGPGHGVAPEPRGAAADPGSSRAPPPADEPQPS